MSTSDGIPAFPSHGNMGEVAHQGVTIREYFAAHAPAVPDFQVFPIFQWTQDDIVALEGGRKEIRAVLHQESLAERSARWATEYADAIITELAK